MKIWICVELHNVDIKTKAGVIKTTGKFHIPVEGNKNSIHIEACRLVHSFLSDTELREKALTEDDREGIKTFGQLGCALNEQVNREYHGNYRTYKTLYNSADYHGASFKIQLKWDGGIK